MYARGGSAHNGLSHFNGAAGYASAWLSEGLCIRDIPEVYTGWNDPQSGI